MNENMDKAKLSHLDQEGKARMVDVGSKPDTERMAIAEGRIRMQPETLALVLSGKSEKGDVLTVARVAGFQAAKRTHDLIPMCHPLLLSHISVELAPREEQGQAWIEIEATVRTRGKTGVEMEALTAASVAALTVYDMCKAVDRTMEITDLHLAFKSGGMSGTWNWEER
jgi:cyclic pyranopterin phosphate synthase